ncbi:unnamed protein product [Darwinula stevensoni]|uniref:T-complex protein 1 subunit delta n=1 Tax=Darwinula stevensoni TaxID=69355 RepID=A0A7R9AE86_9CRUS|nr:unnamed protein product [Darwinula stevensoni]CAG0901743.1 unnamed protein product [Darwinula stevensoni]
MRSLKALYDNYKPLVTDQETDTAQENQEVDKFLDDILASDVMIQAHQFLGRKKLAPSSAKAFRDEMKRLWFEHYPRAKGTLSSNGFEHVFMGEIKNKEVSGFHSWLYFINQEALGNLNYKGWIKRLSMGHVSLLKAQFEWEGERKPLTSMFVGSSPELEMALYTICFKTRSGKECPLTGNGKTFSIQTHPLTYQGKTYIGSPVASGGARNAPSQSNKGYKDKEKPTQIRGSNITAARAVADAIRTSLGPRGMDKMIQAAKGGEVTITNDGATILKQMQVVHPAAKMLVELSKAQDVEAGDGTTSVVVMAGSLLEQAEKLLAKGMHPMIISEAFQKAAEASVEILKNIAQPVELSDRESLLKSASTSLNSKVVSQHSGLLAPIAVDAVMKVIDPSKDTNVDLADVKIIKQLGGTVEDTELVKGLVLSQKSQGTGGPNRVEKARIGLIQFCISPPKTDMDNQVIVSDYTQMDRVLREERTYILNIVKQIKKSGCNVLLIQKSILRDAVSDLALHFLAKMKIMVVKDVERDDIEFICKTIGCRPIASLDHFVAEALGSAELAEEVTTGTNKFVKITGIPAEGKTVTVLLRGSNKLVLEEAERSLHDALCVIRCLVKNRAIIAGGGAPEIELSLRLNELSRSMTGLEAYCFKAFAEAMEVIPYTLAENAGLNPIRTVTELRNRHAHGEFTTGINVRKGTITNILEENVVQPLLVSRSAITLASETVRSILKIDDIVNVIR